MTNEHLGTDLETLFLEIITEERIIRLNGSSRKFGAYVKMHQGEC